VAVGDELDQGVEAGEQPVVRGRHGDSFECDWGLGGRSLPSAKARQKGAATICG
jgi:hypothetical protein